MAKILLVEDDIALRDIYTDAFAAEGHQVVVASDGEEAIKVATEQKPDVILLDIMMPKVSGFEVLAYLRSNEATKNMKIIILSALSQKKDIGTGQELGADEYLVKAEVTLSEVLDKVRTVLG